MKNIFFDGVLPIIGSDLAGHWNHLWTFLVLLSFLFFVLVVGGMIFFAVKYRKSVHPKAEYILGHHQLEIVWTAVPVVLLLGIFVWGWAVWNKMVNPPADSITINVLAKKWDWTFIYEDGRASAADLYVPVNKPVKLVMSSSDVIHSFFVPNFRIKQDAVPGMYTTTWFEATVPGVHQVFCTEYCGASHSKMLARVIALSPDQWNLWKRTGKVEIPPVAGSPVAEAGLPATDHLKSGGAELKNVLAEQGKQIFEAKGCTACHSVDGSNKVGPTLKGLFGHEVELADGKKVLVDEPYVRESIENPNAKLVKGYAGVMPTFKGVINEQEMTALTAYVKSLR